MSTKFAYLLTNSIIRMFAVTGGGGGGGGGIAISNKPYLYHC